MFASTNIMKSKKIAPIKTLLYHLGKDWAEPRVTLAGFSILPEELDTLLDTNKRDWHWQVPNHILTVIENVSFKQIFLQYFWLTNGTRYNSLHFFVYYSRFFLLTVQNWKTGYLSNHFFYQAIRSKFESHAVAVGVVNHNIRQQDIWILLAGFLEG